MLALGRKMARFRSNVQKPMVWATKGPLKQKLQNFVLLPFSRGQIVINTPFIPMPPHYPE